MSVIKKAKAVYIFYLNDKNKYFDLTSNSNILGHSFKRVTTHVKNDISNRWRIKGESIYHKRMAKLFFNLYGSQYKWMIDFSFKDIFFRLGNYFNIKIEGNNLLRWFNDNLNLPEKKGQKDLIIFDMAYYYLYDYKIEKSKELSILNYYHYPYLEIETLDSDLIILPEIFSGNFSYVNILVKRGSEFENIFDRPEEIESLIISSSLKNYYLIKKYSTTNIIENILNKDMFFQRGRIFVLKNFNDKNIEYLKSKRIIINKNPPFYNYIPIILEEHEIKYLKSIKME